MIKKNYILILILLLFLNTVLISVDAQTTKDVDVDGDQHPEFIIHWRYSDFPDNTRADTVVSLIEDSIKEAWQKSI